MATTGDQHRSSALVSTTLYQNRDLRFTPKSGHCLIAEPLSSNAQSWNIHRRAGFLPVRRPRELNGADVRKLLFHLRKLPMAPGIRCRTGLLTLEHIQQTYSAKRQMTEKKITMKAIVVTDQAAG